MTGVVVFGFGFVAAAIVTIVSEYRPRLEPVWWGCLILIVLAALLMRHPILGIVGAFAGVGFAGQALNPIHFPDGRMPRPGEEYSQ